MRYCGAASFLITQAAFLSRIAHVEAVDECTSVVGRIDTLATMDLFCYELEVNTYNCIDYFSNRTPRPPL